MNQSQDQPAAVTGRLGGVYIPPFKLAQMKKDAAALEKGSREYQRLAWDALRKSINGLINKVNASNIKVGGWVTKLTNKTNPRGLNICCSSPLFITSFRYCCFWVVIVTAADA